MAEQHWTPKMVEARLEAAAFTLRRLPEPTIQKRVTQWPPIIRDTHEAYGWDEVRVRLGPPSPEAIDRMDEAFTWLQWLEPDESKLVWLRACRVPWKLITWRFGIGRTTAWQRWVAALMSVASRLNGGAERQGLGSDNVSPRNCQI